MLSEGGETRLLISSEPCVVVGGGWEEKRRRDLFYITGDIVKCTYYESTISEFHKQLQSAICPPSHSKLMQQS